MNPFLRDPFYHSWANEIRQCKSLTQKAQKSNYLLLSAVKLKYLLPFQWAEDECYRNVMTLLQERWQHQVITSRCFTGDKPRGTRLSGISFTTHKGEGKKTTPAFADSCLSLPVSIPILYTLRSGAGARVTTFGGTRICRQHGNPSSSHVNYTGRVLLTTHKAVIYVGNPRAQYLTESNLIFAILHNSVKLYTVRRKIEEMLQRIT